ncbi:hypothetical protein GGR56DRAFT_660544 [Xylariaceae sp. FL0804]|nr:hypothetical protein GGR56DRAFT_660544 [Xylariaceae sp. FL0804]
MSTPNSSKGVHNWRRRNSCPALVPPSCLRRSSPMKNRFTHFFTSFAFHCLEDHDKAAREVYRALKPDGVAVASIWIYMPYVNALQYAHWRTRGKAGPLEGFEEKDLSSALEAGGFSFDSISCSTKDCFLVVPELGRWAKLAWTYLGPLPSGWSQNDEGKWYEAIADIV